MMKFVEKVRVEALPDLERELSRVTGRINSSHLDTTTKRALVSLTTSTLQSFRPQLELGRAPLSARRVLDGSQYRLIFEIGPKKGLLSSLAGLLRR